LGIELMVEDSASRAVAVGRSGGLLSNAFRYLRSAWGEELLPAVVRVDRGRFDAALAKLEPALIDDPPLPGGIAIENGVAHATAPRRGRKIRPDVLLRACSDAVALG